MSNYSEKIEKLFKISFPSYRLKKEKYVFFNNTKLFFDFYVSEMRLLIEVQGQQHYSFNKFFHTSKSDFEKQKVNDNSKAEWAADNGYKFLTINYDMIDKLDEKSFKKLIIDSL